VCGAKDICLQGSGITFCSASVGGARDGGWGIAPAFEEHLSEDGEVLEFGIA
jgi:hypothetical protein